MRGRVSTLKVQDIVRYHNPHAQEDAYNGAPGMLIRLPVEGGEARVFLMRHGLRWVAAKYLKTIPREGPVEIYKRAVRLFADAGIAFVEDPCEENHAIFLLLGAAYKRALVDYTDRGRLSKPRGQLRLVRNNE